MTDILLTPIAEEQECIVLCAVIMQDLPPDELLTKLSEDDFCIDENRYIFNCIKSLMAKKKSINYNTLFAFLKERDKKNPFPVNALSKIMQYAKFNTDSSFIILKEKSAKRKLLALSNEIMQMVKNPDNESEHIISTINHSINGIDGAKNSDIKVYDVYDLLKKRYYELEESTTGSNLQAGIMSGISTIDDMTNGFKDGDYIVIAARPSMGKSALMMNMAYNIATNTYNPPVLVISIEMKKEKLIDRLFSFASGLDQNIIKYGNVRNEHLNRYANVIDNIDNGRIFITDKPSVTTAQIKSIIRNHQRKHGVGIVFIDYMAKIRYSNPKDDEYNGITQISSDLKECSRELNIPLVCLAQLNRAVEGRPNKRPIMSDLKGSGSIEADADTIGLLYRPGYYGREELIKQKYSPDDEMVAELVIAKNREGLTGTAVLNWFADLSLFQGRK